MDSGQIGVLNVGAGDTKLSFDKSNPAECIRSARIVADMLRRGYALLIEVPDKKRGKVYVRVKEFREDVCEYIIADFDPIEAAAADEAENAQGKSGTEAAADTAGAEARSEAPRPKLRGRTRAVPASTTAGIAVARSAGG